MPITARDAPDVLPAHAKEIFVSAWNSAYGDTCKDRGDRDECASKIAWAAVKNKYHKEGDTWVPKAALVEVNLVITKATLQPDGSMRWQATASDTGLDGYGERTSLQLFQDWIERAETGRSVSFLPPPRKPFLGVSHYPALDGAGEAGLSERLFVDGRQFKADGVFLDGPLGKALFEAVRSERELIKKGQSPDEPIRISAAWWDLEHSHGSFVFTRRALADMCPMCAEGAGDKIYLRGQLDHLAATRVPVHPRTALELEEKSMAKKTRRDDAASIVGDEQADELESKAQELVGKAETEEPVVVLVIKADEDEADVQQAAMKTVGGERFPASDFLVVEDPKSPSTWHLQVKLHGKPNHGLMGGAWAALFDPQGHRGNRYEGPGAGEAKRKLRALYKSENLEPPTTAKADLVEQMSTMHDEADYRPLGGAMSLGDAETFIEAQQMMDRLYTNWDLFRVVVNNILDAPEGTDKQAALSQAVKEFGDRVDSLKANVIDAYLVALANVSPSVQPQPATAEPVEKGVSDMSTQTTQPMTVSDPAAVLGVAVKAALDDGKLSREAKLQAIQDALNTYAGAVKAQLDAVAPPAPGEEIAQAVKAALQPLADQIGLLAAKLNVPVTPAYAGAGPVATPVQKSYVPSGPVGPQTDQLPVSPVTGKPSPLTAMIRRSVYGH